MMAYLGKTREFLLHLDAPEETFQQAHSLRHSTTEAEKKLWSELKNRKLNGLKFRRQHPIHYFIADFYCHEKRLIIEVDGGIHYKPTVKEHDENRTAEFDRLGITVIRFTNEQILKSIDKVLHEIIAFITTQSRPSSPSP
ncbi:MAG: endonuclease domain-containing protein [Bacteroidetes bacterium]|nr:endonuclease domain-containing protein [Bacteroidota bacterium]